jgi:hypothetical protein
MTNVSGCPLRLQPDTFIPYCLAKPVSPLPLPLYRPLFLRARQEKHISAILECYVSLKHEHTRVMFGQ